MFDKNNVATMKTIGELLPLSFGRNDMNANITGGKAEAVDLTQYYDNAGSGSGIAGGQRRPEDDEKGEWVVDEHGSLQGQV